MWLELEPMPVAQLVAFKLQQTGRRCSSWPGGWRGLYGQVPCNEICMPTAESHILFSSKGKAQNENNQNNRRNMFSEFGKSHEVADKFGGSSR